MREIKFRAWDVIENKMFDVCRLDNTGDYDRKWFATPEGKNYSTANIILMQFTGLLDKNGKEIYEGDVVEWEWLNEKRKAPVYWDNHRAMFRAYERSENLLSYVKVRGNIYENPELLKNDGTETSAKV